MRFWDILDFLDLLSTVVRLATVWRFTVCALAGIGAAVAAWTLLPEGDARLAAALVLVLGGVGGGCVWQSIHRSYA